MKSLRWQPIMQAGAMWMSGLRKSLAGRISDMDKIPFPETREFVKSVVSARDRLEAEKKGT